MFTRTIAKVVFLLLVSTFWLSCEDYDESPWGYDDDLYTRASVVGTYQAESRTFQKGCALMKNNSGYTGTGYMDYGGKLSLVEWNNVNVPSAGDYTLMFRYANGSSDDRRCSLTVNDTSTGSVSFSPTGSWTKWKTVSFKARLKAGANKVRVTAISYGGPNLDKMDVVKDESDDNGTSRCVGVAENKKAFLTCPAGEVIEGIEFASYGVPEGSCTTGFTRGTCHATSSLSKVKASCLSKRYCTVTANNSTFGDPCGGTFKKLAIEYTCTQGDTTGVVAKDFVGYFERTPVMNDWHKVNISLENNQLWWKNAAGRRWSLNYAGGILETGSDCPYGVKVIEVEKQSGSDPVKALKFLGGRYNKKTIDNPGDQCPDDPNKTEPGECGCGVPEGSCDQCTNVLLAHEKLVAGEHICSENGKYEFGLSPQGELAIWEGTKTLWSAGTFGSTVHLVMQGDGNLVVYNAIKPLWDSKTAKKPGATLKLENDGRVVIRLGTQELWSKGGDGPSNNPHCKGGQSGEDQKQKVSGSLRYNNRSVPFEMRGGVIAKKNSPNACVQTNVRYGQTQLVALGTSDGGCTSCKKEQPVDRALMENQGFALVRVEGDQDARAEIWIRSFNSRRVDHWSTIAISGKSNAVGWVIATLDVGLNKNKLVSNLVDTGGGKKMEQGDNNWGWLPVSEFQRKSLQFKFVVGFLDDPCSVDEEGESDRMISFWDHGDGDTFFAGIWGEGENLKSRIRMRKLEDWNFDVAIIATGQNP